MKEPTSAYVVSHNDVINDNFNAYFPEIIKKLSNATHIAVDLEFTALGNARSIDMNHRYQAMKQCVESASIASVGLSIFRKKEIPKLPPTSLADRSNSIKPLQHSATDLDVFHVASSQPVKKPENESHNYNVSSSQPTLSKHQSFLSQEEEALIASFLEDDEFSLPAAPTTPIIKKTTETTKKIDIEVPHSQQYECDNFNFLTLKQGDLTVESSTASFLVQHGYSFDKLFVEGIPFTPDLKKNTLKNGAKEDNRLKNLWKHLVSVLRFRKIPLIVHNGLYDLIYIYHSFMGILPKTFKGFLQAVADSFPYGIYDTKHLAIQAGLNSSFLAYVFGASDRLRQNRFVSSTSGAPYFEVEVNESIIKTGTKRKREEEPVQKHDHTKTSFCKAFSEKGYCDLGHGKDDPLHDVQVILDAQLGKSKYPQIYLSDMNDTEGAHAAHFDAYMTGFAFTYFSLTLNPTVLESCKNKMTITGISFPLRFPASKLK